MRQKICVDCKLPKDITDYSINDRGNSNRVCDSCKQATTRKCVKCTQIKPLDSFSKESTNRRRYTCNSCRGKRDYNNRKEEILTKQQFYWANLSIEQKHKYANKVKERLHDLRNQVYTLYGNKCNCCAESQSLFLNIDHINGNGKHDDKRKYGAYNYYLQLLKMGVQSDYRLLCYNCNMGRERNNGICPHNGTDNI